MKSLPTWDQFWANFMDQMGTVLVLSVQSIFVVILTVPATIQAKLLRMYRIRVATRVLNHPIFAANLFDPCPFGTVSK